MSDVVTLHPLAESLVSDWADFEFAGMDDPAPVIRDRLAAIEAAVRADATLAAEARIAELERDLATFTTEPGILVRVGAEHTTYWYNQTRLADAKARAAEAEVAVPDPNTRADWKAMYLNLLSDWAALCELAGVESDASTTEIVVGLNRMDARALLDPDGYRAARAALAAQPAAPEATRAAYLPAPLDIVDDRPAPEAEPERCAVCGIGGGMYHYHVR